MDKIYKITNNINGKVYIGQTKKRIEERFNRHIYDSKRKELAHLYLYSAFNKYGVENFTIELIAEFHESVIDEKEKYYINLYNSFNKDKGYNLTLGGKSKASINIPEEDIVNHYLTTKSCRKTAEYFGIDKESVSLRVKSAGYQLFTSREQQDKQYKVIFENKDIKYFPSFPSIAEYLLENNFPLRSNKVDSIRRGLSDAYRNKKPYYNIFITKDEE